MAGLDKGISEIIDLERRLIDEYRNIIKKAAQSNIRLFVKAFLDANTEIVDMVRNDGAAQFKSKSWSGVISIHATDHLQTGDADPSSLSSVLLFVSRAEESSLKDILKIIEQIESPPDFLEEIKSEKIKLASKADRLYHDLVETKLL